MTSHSFYIPPGELSYPFLYFPGNFILLKALYIRIHNEMIYVTFDSFDRFMPGDTCFAFLHQKAPPFFMRGSQLK